MIDYKQFSDIFVEAFHIFLIYYEKARKMYHYILQASLFFIVIKRAQHIQGIFHKSQIYVDRLHNQVIVPLASPSDNDEFL